MSSSSAQPTAELQRRHLVEAPQVDGNARRPYWLNYSRFAQLHQQGKLTDVQFATGTLWRNDYERIVGPTAADLERIGGRSSFGWEPPLAMLEAQTRLRLAREKMSNLGEELLVLVLISDCSWRALAGAYHCREATVQQTFIAILDELEPVYARAHAEAV